MQQGQQGVHSCNLLLIQLLIRSFVVICSHNTSSVGVWYALRQHLATDKTGHGAGKVCQQRACGKPLMAALVATLRETWNCYLLLPCSVAFSRSRKPNKHSQNTQQQAPYLVLYLPGACHPASQIWQALPPSQRWRWAAACAAAAALATR